MRCTSAISPKIPRHKMQNICKRAKVMNENLVRCKLWRSEVTWVFHEISKKEDLDEDFSNPMWLMVGMRMRKKVSLIKTVIKMNDLNCTSAASWTIFYIFWEAAYSIHHQNCTCKFKKSLREMHKMCWREVFLFSHMGMIILSENM